VTVNPSPVVGVAGLMKLNSIRTSEFKNEGDRIIIIGETRSELDGSEYYKCIHGLVCGEPPKVLIDDEYQTAMTVIKLIENDVENNITAVHDCSTGGLGVAISEMSISGNLGTVINLLNVPGAGEGLSNSEILFSESHGRYVITVKDDALEEILNKIDAPKAVIGTVRGDSLVIDNASVEISINKLKASNHGVIEKFMA
jgi:phosphoribosylformylglycinamidine synthase subunit PurL